ncbi:MAG: response regulator transcription factor, partial [Thermoguttaceae bacterium]
KMNQTSDSRTVFVIDDDAELRDSICALVSSLGVPCRGFASAEAFLVEVSPAQRGVAVVDLRMPGMNGLQLQEELIRRNSRVPVIILTAFARTPTIVKAMQAGAVTAIDKPYHDDDLWDAIRNALEKEQAEWTAAQRQGQFLARLGNLTPDERRIGDLIVAGHSNKAIARQLGLALRTIEKRRHHLFIKLEVDSVAELVALFLVARNFE